VTGAINRLPDGLMEGILRLMGFFRREATLASGSVIFSSIDDTGLTIPAGTQVGYSQTTADGVIMHVFETTASVVIAEGDTESAPVQIAAIEAGVKPVISDGTILTILTPISRLFEATFDGAMVQGSDTESDEEFFNRATTYLASLSRSLANADQVTNYVLSTYSEAFRAKAYDLTRLQEFLIGQIKFESSTSEVHASVVPELATNYYYPTFYYSDETYEFIDVIEGSTPFGDTVNTYTRVRVSGTSVPDYDGVWETTGISGSAPGEYVAYDYGTGTATTTITSSVFDSKLEFLDQVAFSSDDSPGAITIFVSSGTGASLSASDKAVISDDIRQKTIAGLSVYVADVIVAPISVSADIKVKNGYGVLDVRDAVDDFLTAYLSPAEYPFTTIIRKNQLLSLIAQIDGVEYVDSLTLTSDNELISYVDSNDDIAFYFKGTLPSATVTVASV
jgi:hypothetical protein